MGFYLYFTFTASPFQHIGKLVRSDRYGTLHEFWDVITAHELAVIVRVGSRQLERLGAFSVGIYVGNERTGIGTVVSAAADDDPSAVARPGVIALGIGRVDLVHGSYLTCLQVHRPDIGIVVPNVEIAELA